MTASFPRRHSANPSPDPVSSPLPPLPHRFHCAFFPASLPQPPSPHLSASPPRIVEIVVRCRSSRGEGPRRFRSLAVTVAAVACSIAVASSRGDAGLRGSQAGRGGSGIGGTRGGSARAGGLSGERRGYWRRGSASIAQPREQQDGRGGKQRGRGSAQQQGKRGFGERGRRGEGRGAAVVAVVAVVAVLALTPLLAFTSVMPPWLRAHGGAQTEGQVRGEGEVREDSMALCLVGQLRTFELTGPSIAANLVGREGYGKADVFVVTPLDENSAKLLTLRGTGGPEGVGEENVPRLVSVRVFPDFNVNEALYPTHILKGLENGPQGLLQQFSMEAMCAADIAERERRYSRRYKWLMKARPDAFWVAPPPPLGGLEYRSLTAPPGLDFGGVNDRLAVVPRAAGRAAFARLHMLGAVSEGSIEPGKQVEKTASNLHPSLPGAPLHITHYRRVNAESMYARILQHLNVTVTRAPFPFCLVSHHRFFRMLALPNLRNHRGGDYCRPCHHEAPPNPFCEQTGPWPADWPALFDQHVPARLAAGRRAVVAAVEGGREGCEAQVAQLVHVLLTCSSHAPHMLLTCSSHAPHMLLTCSSHAPHMLLTCSSHAPHMLLTCSSHAPHMLLTCSSHAPHMLLTCSSHAPHMLLTCSSHAPHMLLTCSSHAPHMLLTCSSHAPHMLLTCIPLPVSHFSPLMLSLLPLACASPPNPLPFVIQLSLEVRRRTNPSASLTAPPAGHASITPQHQQASASNPSGQASLWQRLLGRLGGRPIASGLDQGGKEEEQAAAEAEAAEAAWREAAWREGWRAPAAAVLCVRHGLGKALVFGASGTGRAGSWCAFHSHLLALNHRCVLALNHRCVLALNHRCVLASLDMDRRTAPHCDLPRGGLAAGVPSTPTCLLSTTGGQPACSQPQVGSLLALNHRWAACLLSTTGACLLSTTGKALVFGASGTGRAGSWCAFHSHLLALNHSSLSPSPSLHPFNTFILFDSVTSPPSSPHFLLPSSIALSLPAAPPSTDLLWDAHLLSGLPSMRLLMLPKPPAQTANAAAQQQSAAGGREVVAEYEAAFAAAVRQIKGEEEVVGRGAAVANADDMLRAVGASMHVDLIRVGAGRLPDLQALLARGLSTCQLLVDVEGAGEGVVQQLTGRGGEGGADAGRAAMARVGGVGGRRLQQVGQGAQQVGAEGGEHVVDQRGADASREIEELDAFLLPDDPLLAKWRGEAVLRDLQRWLSGRSFHLDRCVSGDEERVGRCTFFSLTHCQAPLPSQQTTGR
ncbi:unnamed protein product [Closterium sp. Yama58-4]|nr:unnamed protein product [Closterium sp. Yama58-4]